MGRRPEAATGATISGTGAGSVVKSVYKTGCFLLFISSVSFSQWVTAPDFDDRAQRGINFVYNLEFENAEKEFEELAQHYPSHPAGKFFLGMIEWWKILIDIDDESRDDLFIQKMDDVIDLCDSLLDVNENDVSALFFKGGALGFQGRLRANRSSWIKAANDGRLALPIVQRAFKLAPDNYDILLGIGIYNYYASTIPERYPIVKPVMIFFPAGDKKKGIEQLREASEHARYAAFEAKYFLLQLHYNYERQFDTAYALATSLLKQFPNNVLFHRYVGRSAYVLSKYAEAEQAFQQITLRCELKKRGYGNYAQREAAFYLAMVEMSKQRYAEALKYFYQCDKLCRTIDKDETSGYMVLTNLRIGIIYDLQKKRDYAVMQYQKVKKMRNYENAHELADQYLKEPYGQ
ncbi:MAG: tetratricopeptide repeat protein [Ignavibacteriales bacterium]|nr:tetratricopeptide repeat protein [Ignavibacteriales bacterium]